VGRARATSALEIPVPVPVSISRRRRVAVIIIAAAVGRAIEIPVVSAVPSPGRVMRRRWRGRKVIRGRGWLSWRRRRRRRRGSGGGRGFVEGFWRHIHNLGHWDSENPKFRKKEKGSERERKREEIRFE